MELNVLLIFLKITLTSLGTLSSFAFASLSKFLLWIPSASPATLIISSDEKTGWEVQDCCARRSRALVLASTSAPSCLLTLLRSSYGLLEVQRVSAPSMNMLLCQQIPISVSVCFLFEVTCTSKSVHSQLAPCEGVYFLSTLPNFDCASS